MFISGSLTSPRIQVLSTLLSIRPKFILFNNIRKHLCKYACKHTEIPMDTVRIILYWYQRSGNANL